MMVPTSQRFFLRFLFVLAVWCLAASQGFAEPLKFTPDVYAGWGQQAQDALNHQDYGRLEGLQNVMREFEVEADEPFYVDKYYASLASVANMSKLLAWTDAKPQSDLAWTILSQADLYQARKFRGNKPDQDAPPAALKLFKEYLDKSQACLDKAVKLNPNNPYAWVFYMGLDFLSHADEDKVEFHFEKAIQAQPNCLDAYRNKADYLRLKYGMSSSQYTDFIQGVTSKAPAGSSLGLLELNLVETRILQEVREGTEPTAALKEKEIWSLIQKIFEPYFKDHPDANVMRARYCWLACSAGHWDIAKAQFEALQDEQGAVWFWGGWMSPADYGRSKKDAYDKTQPFFHQPPIQWNQAPPGKTR